VALLEVEELAVAYGQRPPTVVGAGLRLERGRIVGLVGESGSGKSTLARALVGLARIVDGAVRLEGEDVTRLHGRDLRALRGRVQLVFQDPYLSLNPRLTIAETLTHSVRAHARTRTRGVEAAVEALLDDVRLAPALAGSYPHQLSGGQRQRVALARALAADPDVIVADEITSALDVSVQAGILRLLDRLRRERDLACLFISHDLAVVRALSDTVAVMYCGEIVEQAPAELLFSRPRHPYTRSLLDAVPRRASAIRPIDGDAADPMNPPSGCRFHPRCPVGPLADPARERCLAVDPAAACGRGETDFVACHFPLADAPGERE
jgi:peptide/nickel transport system ATP-binding protein